MSEKGQHSHHQFSQNMHILSGVVFSGLVRRVPRRPRRPSSPFLAFLSSSVGERAAACHYTCRRAIVCGAGAGSGAPASCSPGRTTAASRLTKYTLAIDIVSLSAIAHRPQLQTHLQSDNERPGATGEKSGKKSCFETLRSPTGMARGRGGPNQKAVAAKEKKAAVQVVGGCFVGK